MNILFLSDNFPPERNAAASRVFERARHWVNWGHRVTVITSAPNFPEGRVYPGYRNRWHGVESVAGIRVVRVKTFIAPNRGAAARIVDFLSYMCTAAVAALLEEQPDVLVATSPQFFAAVAGSFAAALKGVPFVFELGDLWPATIVAVNAMRPGLGLRLMERLELFLYRHSAAVVALTDTFRQDLMRRGIDGRKIAVVRNGVELSQYQPRARDTELASQWGIAPDRFVIGYVGTHGLCHALENVLDAAGRVRCERAHFLFAGAGAARDQLLEEAARRKLGNVTLMPAQPKELMPRIWSLCDVALVHLKESPTFATVIPSKLFEAMGMGLPLLLAAPEGEASRIVIGEGVGIYVPAEDPGALAAAVDRLAGDPALRETLAATSGRAARGHSRERQAHEMLRVLAAVVGPAGSRSPSECAAG